MIRFYSAWVALALTFNVTGCGLAIGSETTGRLLSVERIWNAAPHNAFTDLVRFNDAFYVGFREGSTHGVPGVGQPGGNLRILRSDDGVDWTSAGLIVGGINRDLRDAKLAVTPDNRLMLEGALAPHTAASQRQSLVWFSDDGTTWSDSTDIGDPNYWLWGVHWQDDAVYSIGYGPTTSSSSNWITRLYRSEDGTTFDTHVPTLNGLSGISEGAMLFLDDGTAHALIRRDAGSQMAQWGTSSGDLTQWTWQESNYRVGGPELIKLPDGRIVAAGRRYDGGQRTSLMFVDPATGALDEFLVLPSGGDTSYPGMVWHEDRLWVSYYSSHEGKSSIYMAQVDFVELDPTNPPPIRHYGATDPILEFWQPYNGSAGVANNGPVDDNGTPAWNIYDNSTTSGSRAAWVRALTPEQLVVAETKGWSMKSRHRVLGTSDTSDGAIEMSVFLNSDEGYLLWFGSDASGNAIVSEMTGSSGGLAKGRSATLGGSGYHEYELVYDADSQTANLYSGSTLLLAGVPQVDLQGNVLNRILWGANASAATGNANYAFVSFRLGNVLAGDYNEDGIVNAADYVLWRNQRGSTTAYFADGNNDGTVTQVDYEVWRSAFNSTDSSLSQNLPICEPTSASLIAVPLLLMAIAHRCSLWG